jgi:hypothetical protein
MKLRTFLSGFIALTIALALASVSVAQQKTPAPKLVVDKVDFDFGKVIEGKVVAHTFKLRNEGSGGSPSLRTSHRPAAARPANSLK